MKNKKLILSFFALFSLFFNLSGNQPNVIFFAVDDMNDWITPMGDMRAFTPNLQRLADRGVTFQNGHTAGIFCAPSRSAIFTGKYPHNSGIYTDQIYFYNHPEYRPLQVAFQEGGYNTYGTGKLFHHPEGCVDQRGWTNFHLRTKEQKQNGWSMDSWKQNAPLPNPYPASKFNQINPKWKGKPFMEVGPIPNEKEEEMADTLRTEWACDIIKKTHDKPFFLALGLYAPHYPNYAPKKYFDLYPLKGIKPPIMKNDDGEDLPAGIQKKVMARKKSVHDKLDKLNIIDTNIQGYLACISYADAMLGRVLDQLDQSPHKENTIIVFWSDHGYAQGQKWHWGKHTLWERTSNVPFLWSGPSIAKNSQTNQTATLIDMYPTLIELCQLKTDSNLDGLSLAKVLKNPKEAFDRTVILPHDHPGSYALIQEDWKYIEYKDGGEELYHSSKDPHEWHNLADKPEYQTIKNNIRQHKPKHFAEPGLSKKKIKIVYENDGFKWQPK